MIAKTNTKNLRQYKGKFSSTVEYMLYFASSTNLVREVKNNYLNFKEILGRCFKFLHVPIRIDGSTLLLNFK